MSGGRRGQAHGEGQGSRCARCRSCGAFCPCVAFGAALLLAFGGGVWVGTQIQCAPRIGLDVASTTQAAFAVGECSPGCRPTDNEDTTSSCYLKTGEGLHDSAVEVQATDSELSRRTPQLLHGLPSVPRRQRHLWPPRTCSQRKPLQGALAVLCNRGRGNGPLALRYRTLWKSGIRHLGHRALVRLLERSRLLKARLVGRRISVWSDSRDLSAVLALREQMQDVYRLRERLATLAPGDWVVDVGGHLGFFALHTWLLRPELNIITVEPSPWNHFLLRLNLLEARSLGVSVTMGGIGSSVGRMQGAHRSHSTWSSSLGGGSLEGATGYEPRVAAPVFFNATVTTLQALMHKWAITRIALMKLDCEGCEWHVALDWKQNGLWHRIDALIGEFHLYNLACFQALLLPQLRPVRCYPPHMDRGSALEVWRLLCRTADRAMDGCTDDHLSIIHMSAGP